MSEEKSPPAEFANAPLPENTDQPGLYLYGIVRARGWRGLERRNRELQRVRYRDIEALVRPVPYALPDIDTGIKQHQQVAESVMRRMTILPAPFGVVFKDRRAVIRLLQQQYLVIDEGLSLLDGHWELRLHISSNATGAGHVEALSDEAMQVYAELRRYARAAVPFVQEEDRLASAAFLVERTSWVEFIERIEDFGVQHKALTFDVTGPWPAYDFVRIVT
ncbi:MAG TPA: GvpL/GvpF family gas vesicle protein [Longimicrobiales bacterium]